MTTRYYILTPGGYPDTQADYIPATSLEHAKDITRKFCDGYLDPACSHVFSAQREPWTEQDPYPDYVVYQGPRGGMAVERA